MAVQVRNFKDSFYLVLVGMVIGSGMIIPGVSGGVMAVVLGSMSKSLMLWPGHGGICGPISNLPYHLF